MRSVWPGTPTLMIEAQQDLMPNLEAQARLLGDNVRAVQGLVAAHPGVAVNFYTPIGEGVGTTGASIYPEQTPLKLAHSIQTTTTLDTLTEQWGGPPFTLLKLDLQGAERDALMGAARTLQTVEVIQLEVSALPYNFKAPLVAEMLPFLDGLGFVMFDIADLRRLGDDTLCQFDVLCVRKGHWLLPG